MSKPLNTLNPATLHLLKKLVAAACADTREGLGQVTAAFAVDETVVIHAKGTVAVAKSTPDAANAQRAVPWDVIAALLQTANERLAACGEAGIDLQKVVEAATKIDPDLSKKAKKEADAHMAALKEPTRAFKWGGVTPQGTATVLATGDNLEPEVVPDTEGAEEAAE